MLRRRCRARSSRAPSPSCRGWAGTRARFYTPGSPSAALQRSAALQCVPRQRRHSTLAPAAITMGYAGWQDTAMVRVPLELPAAYGYVLLSAFISVCAITYLAEKVGQARKKYGVDYPLLYASPYTVRARCDRAATRRAAKTRHRGTCGCVWRLTLPLRGADGGPFPEGGGDCRRQALQLLSGAHAALRSRGVPWKCLVSPLSPPTARASECVGDVPAVPALPAHRRDR